MRNELTQLAQLSQEYESTQERAEQAQRQFEQIVAQALNKSVTWADVLLASG